MMPGPRKQQGLFLAMQIIFHCCLNSGSSWTISCTKNLARELRTVRYATTTDRRQVLLQSVASLFATSSSLLVGSPAAIAVAASTADAKEEENENAQLFTRRGGTTDANNNNDNALFAYQFQPPPGATLTGKPLKTHLDEVNFKVHIPGREPATSSLQFGITVDPVRIDSLRDFGTPEEVAAKVVLAEVNRDGVFDVTLMKDPERLEMDNGDGGTLYYQLNYLSVGKRGKKRFLARFAIANQKLYALTAQCKEEDYQEAETGVQEAMQRAVESFVVLQ